MPISKAPKWQIALCVMLFIAAGAVMYWNRDAIWTRDEHAEMIAKQKEAANRAKLAFPEPGGPKSPHSKSPIPRAAAPAFPATPAVAMVEFQADSNSYRENLAARQFTDVVQAGLGETPGIRWVERQRLHLAIEELNLSSLSLASGAVQLRLGKWVKADLMIRGTFRELGKPSSHLLLEVVDLATGDLTVERRVPIHLSSLSGKLGPTEVGTVAAAAREAISESIDWLSRQKGARTVAALFFRNLSGTDRLDYLEDHLLRALSTGARQDGAVRVLRFPQPTLAREEAELAMLGLTDGDPDIWQRLGDWYVWGSYRELTTSQPASASVPFEQVDVELVVDAWDGLNPPTTLKETAKVAELPTAQDRLVRRVLELARRQSNPMISLGARDEVIDLLRARAFEATRGPFPWATNSLWSRRRNQYAAHLLEVTCFLSPTSPELRAAMIRRRWNHYPPEGWASLCGKIDAVERLMAMSISDAREQRDAAYLVQPEQYAPLLGHALVLLRDRTEKLPGDLPEAVVQEWRDVVLRKLIAVAQRIPKGYAYRTQLARSVIENLLDIPGDPNLTVQAVESWWPILKPEYGAKELNGGRYFTSDREDMILKACLAAGKPEVVDRLFTFSRTEPGADRVFNASPRPEPLVEERPKSFADVESPSATDRTLAPVPVADDVKDLHPPLRGLDMDVSVFPEAGAENAKWIKASHLAWARGRLWIVASVPREPVALVFEPAANSYVRLSAHLGQQPAIRSILGRDSFVWIGTGADGLLRVDARSLEVKEFGGEQGLLSRHVDGLATVDDKLFVRTAGPKLSVLRGDDGKFSDMDADLDNIARRTEPSLFLSHGPWLLFDSPQTKLMDTRSRKTLLLADALAKAGVATGKLDLCAADASGIWVVADGDLLRYQPEAGKVQKMSIPRSRQDLKPPNLLLADGECAWVAYWHQGRRADSKNAVKYESFILLFHSPSQRCVGMFRVNGQVVSMCTSPRRLWLGLTQRVFGCVMEVKKLECYRRAGIAVVPAEADEGAESADSTMGMTPLMGQAYAGRLQAVRQLVAGGADVNASTPGGWTALMSAAAGGQAEVVRELLSHGARPELKTRQSKVTALDVAARIGEADVIKALLENGAKLREMTGDADPTLCAAICSGQTAAVEALLNHGVLIMPRKDTWGPNDRLPLLYAIDLDHREIIRLLAQRGGPRLWEDGMGLNAAAASGDLKLIEELLGLGADPQKRDPNVSSSLGWPAAVGDAGMMKLLLRHGADPNEVVWVDGWESLLAHSCARGRIEVARLLVNAGADVNRAVRKADSVIDTPLTASAATGHADAMKLLVESGADLKRDIEGVRQGDLALIRAGANGHLEVVSVLMHLGYSIDARDHSGRTALMVAAQDRPWHATNAVRGLLELGADATIVGPGGQTALTLAKWDDDRQALTAAIRRAKAPATGDRIAPWLAGRHLIQAAASGDAVAVNRALTEGADPNARDLDGRTAYEIAVQHRRAEVVTVLEKAGASRAGGRRRTE